MLTLVNNQEFKYDSRNSRIESVLQKDEGGKQILNDCKIPQGTTRQLNYLKVQKFNCTFAVMGVCLKLLGQTMKKIKVYNYIFCGTDSCDFSNFFNCFLYMQYIQY